MSLLRQSARTSAVRSSTCVRRLPSSLPSCNRENSPWLAPSTRCEPAPSIASCSGASPPGTRRGPPLPGARSLTRQTEDPLADDGALDLRGAAGDAGRLRPQPLALPLAPQRRTGTDDVEGGV